MRPLELKAEGFTCFADPIEIDFSGLPKDFPRIMDAKAKWSKRSTAYKGTKAVLAQVREKHFEAHINWEWWAASNGAHFHNPDQALDSLNKSMTIAQEGIKLLDDAMAAKRAPAKTAAAPAAAPAAPAAAPAAPK